MQAPEPRETRRIPDWGSIVFGILIIVIGAYVLFKDTLGLALPDVKGDAVWPLILIAVGAVVLLRTLAGDSRHSGPRR
ncbi:MAG: DUF5668 domain-containing protein [Chloroflexota bacterium]